MTTEQAQHIANLLNSRNRLTIPYTADRVKASEDDYVFESKDDEVFACVQVKKVQWYQSEILHLSVRSEHEGKGWGKRMIARAEQKAKEQGSRIAQCTIRVGNIGSEAVFLKSSFHEACRFQNAASGNEVAVFQKVL